MHHVISEWGTAQRADINITVPTATSTWKVTVIFDKDVKAIKVNKGKNEHCDGKVCTFSNRREESFEKVGFKESERNLVKISSVHSSTILTRMYSLYECRVAQ